MRHGLALTIAAMLLSATASADESAENAPENLKVVEISGVSELLAHFDSLGYDPGTNPAILQAIPRTRFTRVPAGWDWNEKGVPLKKSAFFRAVASGVLQANEAILTDRATLESLDPAAMSEEARAWFAGLAEAYGVDTDDPAAAKQALMLRVDIVPASLALAQAAVESGWGTSRFARQGNAMYGQWTKTGGIKAEKSDARLASFDTPFDGVVAYMRNLNTHRAYRGLREARARMRAKGEVIDGYALAVHMSAYAETGQVYVKLLQDMIRGNNIGITDTAKLSDAPVVVIEPR